MIYFDHAATTPPYKEVTETVAEVMARHYGNPSSLHRLGEESDRLLNKAREVCAAALSVSPKEIVFTGGATESNNTAIKGAALQYTNRGKHLITTETEHPSVYECCKQLESWGWEVTYLPVDADGLVAAEQVQAALRQDTVLVSVMHVNNETGTLQPVEEIGAMLKDKAPRVLFHVDGVQGFGKLPLAVKGSGIDLYSLSAHKLRGPKGVGLLYVREGLKLSPLLAGGGQEGGLRSGTENIPYIVAFAKALRLASEGQPGRAAKLGALKDRLLRGMIALPELLINTPGASAPHIVHFSYPGTKAEALLHMLEEEGFFVSTRSACSSRRSEPSRVLLAMGRSPEAASSGIRISLGEEHHEQDIDALLAALKKSVQRLQSLR
ncbi:aminotransferase class V-fold PLP-dependent enzyme [Paenibacillus macerans]|uniref:Aminotransferase class V-fold PLP-dependent enzyme n=1 Tax=Paenibacillus macerans TaxID=44252 RepID=A0A6N8ERH9_PAEMA|nr:cysteine desulfurase family protein [Paenibacillus macerans]MUG22896.1 aminotransferase class V-fold PLP-dependent enzyme [Paenibacillus macerans]UMV46965.1 cysteine desulfurase [Paenibacillus macerans]